MHTEADTTRDVTNRLLRAEGQLRGVIAMLESGRDCADIVVQLAAASRALDRAGFRLLAGQLQQCLTDSPSPADREVDLQQLEKLFLSLA